MATKPALEWYKEIRSHDKLLRLQRIRIFVYCQTETHRCISKSKDNHTHKSSIIQTSKSLKNQSCSKMFPLTHANAFPTNTTLLYIWTRGLRTLPRFENANNYDSYYY